MSSQIQMKNKKNQTIDQKTWPVPNCDAKVLTLDPQLWMTDENGSTLVTVTTSCVMLALGGRP